MTDSYTGIQNGRGRLGPLCDASRSYELAGPITV